MTTAAVIVAAGRGIRAGGEKPKQYQTVAGKTLLRHTVEAFLKAGIETIQVVINPADKAFYEQTTKGLPLMPSIAGGETRQESVFKGLKALKGKGTTTVLIHDAARALISPDLVRRVEDKVRETHAGALPALPLVDTIKRGNGVLALETVPREDLYRAQTPQGFPFAAILKAHEQVARQALTDDAAVAEKAGIPVHMIEGEERNFKITTAEDFKKAEDIMGTQTIRVGKGFDVHRFEKGDHVWLCGIKIRHAQGLKGHSDADVGLHAITDALLGAIAAGDIGDHFPPSDPKWKGASSDRFLKHALTLLKEKGGNLLHVDVTLICEAPKIGPHKTAMQARVSEILDLDQDSVSIKATTTEKLGFTGRGEGIAAEAIVTVKV